MPTHDGAISTEMAHLAAGASSLFGDPRPVHGDPVAEHIKGMRPAGWGAVPAGRRSSSPTRRAGARGRRRRPGSKLVTGGDGGYGGPVEAVTAVRSGRAIGRCFTPYDRMILVVLGEVDL